MARQPYWPWGIGLDKRQARRLRRRIIRRLASAELQATREEAYLRGLRTGRAERPMTCGVPARDHHPSDYWYDPGQ